MATRYSLNMLKDDFSFIKDDSRIIGILLFGSQVSGNITRGDYDICIVSPESKSSEVLSEIYQHVNAYSKKYDLYTFEELPLYMKKEVISNHEIIFARDIPDMYEYFYYFRKLWNEQKMRQNVSIYEMKEMIST